MLCVLDEFTPETMAIRVNRRLNSTDVLETPADLMILRDRRPMFDQTIARTRRAVRSSQFIATTLRDWITAVGSQTA